MSRIFKFLDRYLEPSDRLGQTLFGLVMVLVFTLGARSIVGEGRSAIRDLLVGVIGCNIAWGFICSGMFLIDAMFERSRLGRLVRDAQRATDEEQALAVIGGELDDQLEKVTSAQERERLYRDILGNIKTLVPPKTRLTRADVFGAFAVFWLVTLTIIPALVPFLFIGDLRLALRVSNLLLIGCLFLIGYRWAGITNTNRWAAGLGVMLVGLAMVGIAEALGG